MGFASLEGGCRVLLQGVEVAGRSLIILQQVKKRAVIEYLKECLNTR